MLYCKTCVQPYRQHRKTGCARGGHVRYAAVLQLALGVRGQPGAARDKYDVKAHEDDGIEEMESVRCDVTGTIIVGEIAHATQTGWQRIGEPARLRRCKRHLCR